MPNGRTVLLLRRLSSTDSRFKNFTINQTPSKDSCVTTPVCSNRDLCLSKRLSSSFSNSNISSTQITRNLDQIKSDNIIKMATSHNETSAAEKPKYSNRLTNEKSPYLLQHAHNPVEWYPWGQEAIEKAVKENKLIFLSVGYSTCHWCHVMERETFENEDVAKIMNDNFINIKVDREERPDIDKVYMLFVMAATGGGGWPMSVFLTPDLRPITGGTYFPPHDRWGRPGFKTILLTLSEKWTKNKEQIITAGTNVIEFMQKLTLVDNSDDPSVPDETTWNKCVLIYTRLFEPKFGGFGKAPKFPQASIFNFLFHYYARDKTNLQGKRCLDMCLHTLTKIANGGIHDHVSSGFARYSVDDDWHVPHFEKMLYDQAQLTVAYTDAFLATKDIFYADVVKDIIKYVNRDLRHELGGFYSAEDADSYPSYDEAHKKEGAFYVWDYNEIKTLLEGKNVNGKSYLSIMSDYFNIKSKGNISPASDPHNELNNKNVLIVYGSKEETAEKFSISMEEFDGVLSECISILHEARQKRPRPHLDTKILCSWNGLMIAGLAQAGQGLGEKDYVDDAVKAAQFIKQYLYDQKTKTLIHSCYKAEDGSIAQINTPIKGFLDDYAFLIKGLLDLYEASLDLAWLSWARELQIMQDQLFWDDDKGGYFTCSADDLNVILRLKEDQDGAEPSGNSVSCHNLLRLAAYADKSIAQEGGDGERERARRLLTTFGQKLQDTPTALPEMMSALMFYTDSPTQVLISGEQTDPRTLELVRAVRSRLLPGRVLAVTDPAAPAPIGMPDILLSRLRSAGEAPAAYVCRRYSCSLPVTDVKELETLLDQPSAIPPADN